MSFQNVKLICGIIAKENQVFRKSRSTLIQLFGDIDFESKDFDFSITDYYEKQMGKNLKRRYISFRHLIKPDELSSIKLRTNQIEEDIREDLGKKKRIVNIDPGYLTPSALIMATTKDFSHRVPLQDGIYAHLEFIFGKKEIKFLDWTYPDYMSEGYQEFFLAVRKIYLKQRKAELVAMKLKQ